MEDRLDAQATGSAPRCRRRGRRVRCRLPPPAAPSDHPDTAAVRHLPAYFLARQGRHEAALLQFRLVDGCVGALPWRNWEDPVAVYCLWRNRAVKGVRHR
ncbi:hypothetical protein [Streptomyces sp. NPDC052012]|uniref:hypothetical protein n=1 Tax=Streptomyces sp. NPDC052012 TaxID=3155051 RepID=UPI00344D3C60